MTVCGEKSEEVPDQAAWQRSDSRWEQDVWKVGVASTSYSTTWQEVVRSRRKTEEGGGGCKAAWLLPALLNCCQDAVRSCVLFGSSVSFRIISWAASVWLPRRLQRSLALCQHLHRRHKKCFFWNFILHRTAVILGWSLSRSSIIVIFPTAE